MRRFVAGVHRPWLASRASGLLRRLDEPRPGLPLQLPDRRARPATPSTSTPPSTRTSPCTSCSGTRGRAPPGMPALPRGDRERADAPGSSACCCGYWTHSGFLNWDSGWASSAGRSARRSPSPSRACWRSRSAEDFHARPEFGAVGEVLLRSRPRALQRAGPTRTAAGLLAPPWLNGVHAETGGGDESKILFGARMAANAARADRPRPRGRARRRSRRRSTPTTPTSGAWPFRRRPTRPAILAANHGAVGYGGIELARLYDGDGRPGGDRSAAGRRAAFGVVVRDVANRTLLASQMSRLKPSLGRRRRCA